MAYTTTDQHESGMSANRVDGARSKPLQGLKAICAYMGKTEKTVLRLIKTENFPARKIGGGWESDETSIESWRSGKTA